MAKKKKPQVKLPLVKEMLASGYIHDREESFTDTYKRLKDLGLWKAYRFEQKGLMEAQQTPGVIEETLWNRYSPSAIAARAVDSKKEKAEGPGSQEPTQEDLNWVFQNIDQKPGTYFTSAPSAGADSLYARAKEDTKIYQWVLDHITPKTFSDTGGATWESDKARNLTGIARQLRESFNDRRAKLLASERVGREDESREPASA